MTPKSPYIFETAEYAVIVDPCFRRDLEDIAKPTYLVVHKEHGVAGGVSQQLWAAIDGAKHLQKALDDVRAGKEPRGGGGGSSGLTIQDLLAATRNVSN